MITAAEIRERYPNPSLPIDFTLATGMTPYCVGGAFLMSAWAQLVAREPGFFDFMRGRRGTHTRFPEPETIAHALCGVNSNLFLDDARGLAASITECNDHGNFEAAWQFLDTALTFGDTT